MKIKELAITASTIDSHNPEVEVRIESYYLIDKGVAVINGVSKVIEHVGSRKVTMCNNCEILDY